MITITMTKRTLIIITSLAIAFALGVTGGVLHQGLVSLFTFFELEESVAQHLSGVISICYVAITTITCLKTVLTHLSE